MADVKAKAGFAAAIVMPVALAVAAGVPSGVATAAAGPGSAVPNGCVPASSASTTASAGAPTASLSGTPSAAASTSLPPCPASPQLGWSQHRETPWHLTATKSTMYWLTYNGVVSVQTANGPVRALDFTADSADLDSMVTWAPLSGTSKQLYNNAGQGKTTHLTGVHLHVTRMAGDMFGLVNTAFTPDSPPPLIPGVPTPIPVVLTNVSQDNLELDAKTLTVPGYTVKIF